MKTLLTTLAGAAVFLVSSLVTAGPSLIANVIAEYGVKEVASFLKEKGDGRLYAKTRTGVRLMNRPSIRLVDESTLMRDVLRLKLDAAKLRQELEVRQARNAQTAAELEALQERFDSKPLRTYIENAPSPAAGRPSVQGHSPDMVERARRFTNQREAWSRQENARRYSSPPVRESGHLTYSQRRALRNSQVGAPRYRSDLSAAENAARQNAHNARARSIVGQAGLDPEKYVKDQPLPPPPPPPPVVIIHR